MIQALIQFGVQLHILCEIGNLLASCNSQVQDWAKYKLLFVGKHTDEKIGRGGTNEGTSFPTFVYIL